MDCPGDLLVAGIQLQKGYMIKRFTLHFAQKNGSGILLFSSHFTNWGGLSLCFCTQDASLWPLPRRFKNETETGGFAVKMQGLAQLIITVFGVTQMI